MPKKFYKIVICRQCYKTFFSVIYTSIDATSVNILRKYAKTGVNYCEKSFITMSFVANVIKLFFSVIYTTVDATSVYILRKYAWYKLCQNWYKLCQKVL
jgi:hypothetical protein